MIKHNNQFVYKFYPTLLISKINVKEDSSIFRTRMYNNEMVAETINNSLASLIFKNTSTFEKNKIHSSSILRYIVQFFLPFYCKNMYKYINSNK